jgi:glucosamine--fructose-6-phosphate aminotransferase (isomerizing)
MKHGPIALIAPQCPVLCLACNEENIFEKILSNVQEVRARGARTIVITREGSPIGTTDDVIWIPPAHAVTSSILATIPVQLFAYHMGVLRGCNVDKPRHLAKSVTVE